MSTPNNANASNVSVAKEEPPVESFWKNVLSFCDPKKSTGDTMKKRGVIEDVDTASMEAEEIDGFSLNSHPSPVGVPRSILGPIEDQQENTDKESDTFRGVPKKQGTQIYSPAKTEPKGARTLEEEPKLASFSKAASVLVLLLVLLTAISTGFANIQHQKETVGATTPVLPKSPIELGLDTTLSSVKSREDFAVTDTTTVNHRRRGRRIGRVFKPLKEKVGKVLRKLFKKNK